MCKEPGSGEDISLQYTGCWNCAEQKPLVPAPSTQEAPCSSDRTSSTEQSGKNSAHSWEAQILHKSDITFASNFYLHLQCLSASLVFFDIFYISCNKGLEWTFKILQSSHPKDMLPIPIPSLSGKRTNMDCMTWCSASKSSTSAEFRRFQPPSRHLQGETT